MIPAEQITVTVHDGVVELSGEVSRGAERISAEEAAFDLPGVVDVRNRIVVADVPVQVEQIETTIREAFMSEATAAAAGITTRVEGVRSRSGTTHVAPPPTRRAGCVECHGRRRGA